MVNQVAAGFIIYKRLNDCVQYLLLQTSYGIHHWTPPKGHVDPGESEIETAYRETNEEAGFSKESLHIHNDMKIELFYEANGIPKRTVYWLARLKDLDTKVKLSDEHQDYKWLSLVDASELAGFSDMKEALRKCQKYVEEQII